MKLKYLLPFFAFLLITVSFVGCLDVNRKIIIKPDGSGMELQQIKIDRSFYDMIIMMVSAMDTTKSVSIRDSLYDHTEMIGKIQANLSGREGIVLKKVDGRTEPDSSNVYTLEYTFDDVKRLSYTTNVNPDNQLSSGSRTESKWTDNGKEVLFSFIYISEPDPTKNEQQQFGLEELFKGKNMTFDIEFPYDIVSSNATSVNGRNAVWVFPVYDIYMNSAKLNLDAKLKK
jgi:hypothetical protein